MTPPYASTALRRVAEELTEYLGDRAVRVEVAGSVARGLLTSKDLDLVIEPRTARPDLFEEWSPDFLDAIEGWDRWQVVDREGLPTRPTATSRQVICRSRKVPDFKIELYLAGRDRFGVIQMIRTGPQDFAKAMVGLAPKYGCQFHEGALWLLDRADTRIERIPCPTEHEVFRAMGLTWITPAARDPQRLYAADRHRGPALRPPPQFTKPRQGSLFSQTA